MLTLWDPPSVVRGVPSKGPVGPGNLRHRWRGDRHIPEFSSRPGKYESTSVDVRTIDSAERRQIGGLRCVDVGPASNCRAADSCHLELPAFERQCASVLVALGASANMVLVYAKDDRTHPRRRDSAPVEGSRFKLPPTEQASRRQESARYNCDRDDRHNRQRAWNACHEEAQISTARAKPGSEARRPLRREAEIGRELARRL